MHDLPPLGVPGQRLGRYELIQRIAVGGMAEVYRAYAVGPGDFRKLVAVKRLLPQHALDPQLLRMFLDESRLMARFAHPNLPQVLDVNDGGGQDVPFFVMEHVAGVDLRDILRAAAGPLPLEQVVALASGVAAGLHHAHELRGEDGRPLEIVHRDVSPSNVLVSFDGGVKVTDFGVAKWQQQKSFTYQGQLKGKFAHMSPEQCRAEPLDRRSDVFALGTLLYELATGQPPFRADSEVELLSRIASQDAPPPPRGPDGEVAPELVAIIMRCLERERERRFATAQDVQLALEAFARERRLNVSPVGLGGYVASLFGEREAAWRSAAGGARGEAIPEKAPVLPSVRTATDTFALEETLVSQNERLQALEAGPPPEPAPPPRPAHRRRGLAVGLAGGAALLLALGSYAAFGPTRVAAPPTAAAPASPTPPPAAPSSATKPTDRATAVARLEPAQPPVAQPIAPPPAEAPLRSARSVRPRRPQNGAARVTADAPDAESRPVVPAAPVAAPAPAVDPVRAPPPPHPDTQAKVWDPDSPVPP